MRVGLSVLAVAFAALSACGRNSGFARDASTGSEHQFRMDVAAQRYSRSVSGASSIGSLFCIIPMRNGAYKDAMAALHAQAKLRTNEVLESIREDHAFISYILYCEDDLIISADVYEVVPAAVVPAEAPRARGGDCDPPYSIDAQGRKLFKSECLSSDHEPSDSSKPPSIRYAPPSPVRLSDAGMVLE